MKLNILKKIKKEICHYYDGEVTIFSHFNKIYYQKGKEKYSIELPLALHFKIAGIFRLFRRALRLDKCNVVPVGENLLILYRANLYLYEKKSDTLIHKLKMQNCRNTLHQAILNIDDKEIVFGEYGNNGNRESVPVYRSIDGGNNWETVDIFKKNSIKHIHGCYYDKYEDKVWILTGDFEAECYLVVCDREFKEIEWIGTGNQEYRACNLFFNEDRIDWIMDSPLENSYHIKLNRIDRTIEQKELFAGPVWYIKRLDDGYYLASTAQEIGVGVKDDFAHIYASKDLENWKSIYQFKHDGLPKRYFKFGTINFSDGKQGSKRFYFSSEALSGFDGISVECSLVE